MPTFKYYKPGPRGTMRSFSTRFDMASTFVNVATEVTVAPLATPRPAYTAAHTALATFSTAPTTYTSTSCIASSGYYCTTAGTPISCPMTYTGRRNFVACVPASSLPSAAHCCAVYSYFRRSTGTFTLSLARTQASRSTYSRYSLTALSASQSFVTEIDVLRDLTRSFKVPVRSFAFFTLEP